MVDQPIRSGITSGSLSSISLRSPTASTASLGGWAGWVAGGLSSYTNTHHLSLRVPTQLKWPGAKLSRA